MSKYQAYPEYTKTELGWLTEIPKHWEIKKLKYLGEALIGLTYSPNDVVDENEGTLVLRSSNVQNGQLSFKDNVFVKKQIPEHLKVKSGDILICARNGSRALIGKNALITKDAEGMSFGAFMSVFRSPYNNYLSKVFNSALFEYQSGSFLTATINQLTTSNLNSFEIPLPPENERNLIAAFLDHETAKIDTLIEKQQQLIELLKEKRQAVISHTVTKGLNPDATMKDSGVEWLGEVPEHWQSASLRRIIKLMEQGKSPECLNVPANENQWGVLKTSCVNGGIFSPIENKALPAHLSPHTQYQVQAGDIVMSRASGSVNLIGSVALVQDDIQTNLLLSDKIFRLFLTSNMDSQYFVYLMNSQYVRKLIEMSISGAEGMANNITKSAIMAFPIVIAPLKEQQEIANHLKNKLSYFEQLIKKATSAIYLIQERRTALISAAVTGKIDVRNWVAPTTNSDANEAVQEVTV